MALRHLIFCLNIITFTWRFLWVRDFFLFNCLGSARRRTKWRKICVIDSIFKYRSLSIADIGCDKKSILDKRKISWSICKSQVGFIIHGFEDIKFVPKIVLLDVPYKKNYLSDISILHDVMEHPPVHHNSLFEYYFCHLQRFILSSRCEVKK